MAGEKSDQVVSRTLECEETKEVVGGVVSKHKKARPTAKTCQAKTVHGSHRVRGWVRGRHVTFRCGGRRAPQNDK